MKNCLSSPLAVNYLLSLYKNGPLYQKQYLQIYKDLKVKKGYRSSNQIFLSPSYNAEKQYETTDISIENVGFGKTKDAIQCIMKWINQYGSFSQQDIEKHVSASTTSVLCNISVFKSIWKCHQPSPVMNVHNSFSYTEDIKYEARLIELPMHDDDFKLVIIVPNEVSSVSGLFNILVEEGLEAAISCVQPLFTFYTVLDAPSIDFSSEGSICLSENNSDVLNGAQIGNVHINENGTNISVLTLLNSTIKNSTVSVGDEQSETELPFYFAVLYKDNAIFTGRYMKRVK